MNVLVDTCIWSLGLRRSELNKDSNTFELRELIKESRAKIIGPIRQELLSGIRSHEQFTLIAKHIDAFPNLEVINDDYVRAAEIFNTNRSNGIQGSNTDFLICAVAERYQFPIFTTDKDFQRFTKLCDISIHKHRNI